MLKFNEQQQIDDIQGMLDLRPEIEKLVDTLDEKGFDAIYYLGIGGTYASAMQAVTYINGKSDLPVYVQHAAEYYTTGNRRLTKRLISYLVICHWYDTRSGKGCRRNQKSRSDITRIY